MMGAPKNLREQWIDASADNRESGKRATAPANFPPSIAEILATLLQP
jgi:hypothetical protein